MATMPLTVNLRITIEGQSCPRWRIRALGWAAKLLRVPLTVHPAPREEKP